MSSSYISPQLRREVIDRAGNCCEYCLINQEDQFFALEIDHIIAEKHGGPSTSINLALACPDCNAFKGSDIASVDWDDEAKIVGLFHPRNHEWQDHFRLDTSNGRIEPLTAQGRVTVFLLRINDAERVTDRQLLIAVNRYPCRKE
jgi:5-methylcytosine-specific restriction endonuclease McrA